LDQEIENTEKSPYRSQWSTRRLKNKSAPANEYKKLLNEKKKDQPWDENGRFLPVEATVASTDSEERGRSRKIVFEKW